MDIYPTYQEYAQKQFTIKNIITGGGMRSKSLVLKSLLLFFTISAIKGNNKNISIYIPKTLSSIPILELDKKSINNIPKLLDKISLNKF